MAKGAQVNGTAKVGDRVAYEDVANPYQEGTVTEVIGGGSDEEFEADMSLLLQGGVSGERIAAMRRTRMSGPQYRVAFDASPSKFGEKYGLPARETVSDLRQHGWTFVIAEAIPNRYESYRASGSTTIYTVWLEKKFAEFYEITEGRPLMEGDGVIRGVEVTTWMERQRLFLHEHGSEFDVWLAAEVAKPRYLFTADMPADEGEGHDHLSGQGCVIVDEKPEGWEFGPLVRFASGETLLVRADELTEIRKPSPPSVSSDPRDGYALGDPKRLAFEGGWVRMLLRVVLNLAWFSTAALGFIHVVEGRPLSVYEVVALGAAASLGFVARVMELVEEGVR